MGTGWTVKLAAPPGVDARALEQAIQARLDHLVDEMSHWTATSRLAAFNRSAPGSWTALPADFAAVIAAGLTVAEQSAGAFDPAAGRLTDLWGLGPNPRNAPPSDSEIAQARSASGWHRVAYDREGRRVRQPGGTWLDLSGIAKGYAADAMAALLGRAGHRHFLAEIGGECVGAGMRPDGDPWWVALETPPHSTLPPLRVALHQLAVATSGDYVRGAHTLDPRSGRLVADPPAVVSVLHASAMRADAWATALFVLPRDEARRHAVDLGLAARIVGRDDAEWLSPALSAMID
jgi:thiamine biosynthesis lipoprotein